MKKETTNHIKLGLFVTLGILILMTGIYFIGETKKLFSTTFKLTTFFKDVNGLQIGNNVRFAGINVGTISDISIITDSTVKVDMILDINTQQFIKKDAKATIGSDGLMGNKILTVSSGTSKEKTIESDDIIGTTIPVSMDDLLTSFKTTVDNAALITNDLADIMENIHSGKGTIGKLFMDTVFAEDLNKTIINVKQGTKGFKQNMDAAKKSILLRGYFKKKKEKKK
jgi:phospholipid/cholesterol/gamma-HCH transport system substrate-binding protein